MPTLHNIRLGLEILEKHMEPDDYQFLYAEHDEIYAGNKPKPDSDDGRKLQELGWIWDTSYEGWSAFV
jgi:hypothetical protein